MADFRHDSIPTARDHDAAFIERGSSINMQLDVTEDPMRLTHAGLSAPYDFVYFLERIEEGAGGLLVFSLLFPPSRRLGLAHQAVLGGEARAVVSQLRWGLCREPLGVDLPVKDGFLHDGGSADRELRLLLQSGQRLSKLTL